MRGRRGAGLERRIKGELDVTHRYSREELLLGEEKLNRLKNAKVAVFGAGGVGGYVIEALARSGVGALDIIDGDKVSLTNINRQIIALTNTVGRLKAEVSRERVLQIDPECRARACPLFFTEENQGDLDFSQYDYVADAIDTVSSKILVIRLAKEAGVPVISCMGAGNKFDPTAFRVADIEDTSVCPLARVMRRELRKRGIFGVKAVYSTEEARTPYPGEEGDRKGTAGRPTPGSMSFVPSAAGLVMAAEIVKDLVDGWPERNKENGHREN